MPHPSSRASARASPGCSGSLPAAGGRSPVRGRVRAKHGLPPDRRGGAAGYPARAGIRRGASRRGRPSAPRLAPPTLGHTAGRRARPQDRYAQVGFGQRGIAAVGGGEIGQSSPALGHGRIGLLHRAKGRAVIQSGHRGLAIVADPTGECSPPWRAVRSPAPRRTCRAPASARSTPADNPVAPARRVRERLRESPRRCDRRPWHRRVGTTAGARHRA